jgi:hypothetical protein
MPTTINVVSEAEFHRNRLPLREIELKAYLSPTRASILAMRIFRMNLWLRALQDHLWFGFSRDAELMT